MKNIRPHTITTTTRKPIVYMAWTVGENPLDGHYHTTPKPATIRTKRIPAWKSPTLQRR